MTNSAECLWVFVPRVEHTESQRLLAPLLSLFLLLNHTSESKTP